MQRFRRVFAKRKCEVTNMNQTEELNYLRSSLTELEKKLRIRGFEMTHNFNYSLGILRKMH